MQEPYPDLRTFLAQWRESHPDFFLDIASPIECRFELTALQHKLWEVGRHPLIIAHQPRRIDGEISRFKVITNLAASRDLCAAALGLGEPRRAAVEYARLAARPIPPVIVSPQEAAVKEVILKGDEINLLEFPVIWQHERDAGPYFTAAHVSTYDPDTGEDNTAIQRCWVKAPHQTGIFPYPGSHNYRNMQKFWQRGEKAPVAIWIGHHPAVVLGSQAKLGYPESHWPSVGSFLGQPLRLVASENFGEKLLVPAEAEIVIEGYVGAETFPEGPFGEFTGFTGDIKNAPLLEVVTVTHRHDAIYHDYASGLPDMLVADNMALEAKIYQIVKQIAPDVQNVHVPISGRRMHAYIQLAPGTRYGVARDVIMAALSFRRVKHVFVVDADIDIFDEPQVWWAIATRSQWPRDLILVENISGSALDPSLPETAKGMSGKGGIDATLKPDASGTVSRVPGDVYARLKLEDFADYDQIMKFPTAL